MSQTFAESGSTAHKVGPLTLYVEEHRLEGPRGELRLSGAHFRIMLRLMRRPGMVVERSDLISALYPDADDEGENGDACLRQIVMSLRRAIALLGCEKAVLLITERGIGHAIRTTTLMVGPRPTGEMRS
jgi:DNA-binding response OmpR family regulator